MPDILDTLLQHGPDEAAEPNLRRSVVDHQERLVARRHPDTGKVVADAERMVTADPAAAFAFAEDGRATLTCRKDVWSAGKFEVVSLSELRRRCDARVKAAGSGGAARLWVLDGGSPLTDIGALQATCGDGTVFQVASQFNCLEAPDAYITSVESYLHDNTQGPRASISAFPATLLRHYQAPDEGGERFVQREDAPQLNLLSGAGGGGGEVRNGYLKAQYIADMPKFAEELERNFGEICVGVHTDVEVVRGYNWHGFVDADPAPRIGQVFTSTIALGGYSDSHLIGAETRRISQTLLRAAYLGTLLAAVDGSAKRVVLTLIGGGAFGNDIGDIWEAIKWSVEEIQPLVCRDLDVVVNGYNLAALIDLEMVAPDVLKHGGLVFEFRTYGLEKVWR